MRIIYIFFIALSIIYSGTLFADEPIISRNVPVLQNIGPGQCPSSWRSTSSPIETQSLSGYGMEDTTTPGIVSCTGCNYDGNTKSCICDTCYQYYND